MLDLSADEIAQIGEFAEAAFGADLVHAAPPALAAELGLGVEQISSAVALVARAVDYVLFNRVVGLGLREPATAAMVDQIANLYQAAGVQAAVQVSPAAGPAALPDWLAVRDRTYEEVMDAWRTSCPRLPVWEEANDRGLIIQEPLNGTYVVRVSESGQALLHRVKFETTVIDRFVE